MAGELPLEGRCDLFVAAAKGQEVLLEGVEVWEVVGGRQSVSRQRGE